MLLVVISGSKVITADTQAEKRGQELTSYFHRIFVTVEGSVNRGTTDKTIAQIHFLRSKRVKNHSYRVIKQKNKMILMINSS